jgi:hypothetical protein
MALDVKQPKGYRKSWNGGKPPKESAAAAAFYAHLDACEQCRHHPFDLCAAGALLIRLAIATPPEDHQP